MPSLKALLTIAIPTYNRCACLSELLTYLAPQIKKVPNVELLICDNASTDETTAMIETFRSSGLALVYFRNDCNLGMDRNFLQCFERARGKYVWLIGDDDVLIPGGLEIVVGLLGLDDADLVYVASVPFHGAYSAGFEPGKQKPKRLTDALQYIKEIHIALTFLSGNIVNKDRILASVHPEFALLDGTKLVQLGWIYTALRHFTSGVIIREPLIAARADNTGGYAVFTVFGVSLRRITESWLIEPRMVRVMLNGTIHYFFPWFLLKMKGLQHKFDDEDPHVILSRALGDRLQYWLFDYPIIILPPSLAKAWYLLGRLALKLDGYFGAPIFG